MTTNEKQFEVRRLLSLEDGLIAQLNELFESGKRWDPTEGAGFLADRDNAFFAAFASEQLIGFATGQRLGRFDKRKASVLLYEIGVAEQYRGRGVGKALIARVQLWAKEIGADEVWVVAEQSNIAAINLYKSAGGRVESESVQVIVFGDL